MLVLAANALNDSFRSSSESSTLALYAAPLNNSGRLSEPYVVALASSGSSVKVHSVDTQSLCEWCIWEKYKLWLTPFPQSKQILIFCTYKKRSFHHCRHWRGHHLMKMLRTMKLKSNWNHSQAAWQIGHEPAHLTSRTTPWVIKINRVPFWFPLSKKKHDHDAMISYHCWWPCLTFFW